MEPIILFTKTELVDLRYEEVPFIHLTGQNVTISSPSPGQYDVKEESQAEALQTSNMPSLSFLQSPSYLDNPMIRAEVDRDIERGKPTDISEASVPKDRFTQLLSQALQLGRLKREVTDKQNQFARDFESAYFRQ